VVDVDAVIATVEGTVQPGDRRGRELGFPTANVHSPNAVRLDGVYAAILQVEPAADGPSYVAAVSVGHRPTFYGRDGLRLLEAHLLDFAGDLYGRQVRIELHARLRVQRKYVDEGALVRQLGWDVEATRSWARANGWEHLLKRNPAHWKESARVDACASRPKPVIRGKKQSGAIRSAERKERREEQFRQAIDECGAFEDVSPEWLAQRVGVPVGCAQWYLASFDE
jgi:hypothetical protein